MEETRNKLPVNDTHTDTSFRNLASLRSSPYEEALVNLCKFFFMELTSLLSVGV